MKRLENPALWQLNDSTERQEFLRRTYGHLPLEQAVSLVNAGLTKSYRDVDIFGLSFSTRRFPFAVLFFLVVALLGILVTLRMAKQHSLRIFHDITADDALDVLVDSLPARCLLWGVLPALALLQALPPVSLPSVEAAALYVGLAAVIGVGALNVRESARL